MLKDPDGNFVEIVGPNTKKLRSEKKFKDLNNLWSTLWIGMIYAIIFFYFSKIIVSKFDSVDILLYDYFSH